MRILLLSGYDAPSHRRWCQGLMTHLSEHQWARLSLPPRYFNWRVRGNSLSWAFSEREKLEQPYDLLIATSMVDLSALRGFVPSLGQLPSIVYCHENQFDYPSSNHQQHRLEPQVLSLYSALCADVLVFNSRYNRDTFFGGAAQLLKKLPDCVPEGLVERLQTRTQVLPVPLESDCYRSHSRLKGEPLSLVWNHRWEYDKGPDRLLRLAQALLARNFEFRLHVVGQQFRAQPSEFAELKTTLESAGALGAWGFVESVDEYRQLLASSDIALSTALHDFQGLALMEAVACGCVPLAPKRQAYPEWFGYEHCYNSYLDNPEREALELAERVVTMAERQRPSPIDLNTFSWDHLADCYRQLIEQAMR